MTPKQKAIKLYNNYMEMPYPTHSDRAKQCALIAADELIEESIGYLSIERNKYWKEVKKEIKKL
jgi:hypothetical protein